MSLPTSTTVLVVGAGPSGLSVALSLLNSGLKPEDIVIVDAIEKGENTPRAIVIHAATLEALGPLGCADDLASMGIQAKRFVVRSNLSHFITVPYEDSLKGYTKFPYALLLSQARTEEVLNKRLEEKGVRVVRPHRVTGMSSSPEGFQVGFENGEIVKAKYVIGADGARSVIRTMNNITFADPDGKAHDQSIDANVGQIVLTDVTFSDPGVPFPRDEMSGFGSANGMFLLFPMPEESGKEVWRIGFNVPLSKGAPPSQPSLEYIQERVNQNGPPQLSSDPKRNPSGQPVQVEKVIWSTRFRTHSAISETFWKQVDGGIVVLVGDSAHIHSPAGGLGMNLGMRDAIGLGPLIVAHIKSSSSKGLDEYAAARREKALHTIRTTKRMMTVAAAITSKSIFSLPYLLVRIIGSIPFVRNRIAWNLSGLGNP